MSERGASPGAVRVVAGGVLAVGLATAIGACALDPRPWFGTSLVALPLLSVLLVWVHVRPERVVPGRGGVESIQLDAVVLVPVLLFAGPVGALLATAAASVAGGLVAKRRPVQMVFNLGQLLLATSLAVAVVGHLGDGRVPPASVAPQLLLVAMGAVLVVETVSSVAVNLMVAFATGSPVHMLRTIGAQLVPWSGAVLLGGVGTVAALTSPAVAVLVTALVAFVHRAYATSLTEYAARHRAEEAQRVVTALRGHTDSATVRREVLAAARDLLGAEHVEFTTAGGVDPAGSLSVPLGAGRLVVSGRQGVGTWSEQDRDTLATLAGVAGDVLRATELIERLHTITASQSEGLIAFGMAGAMTVANPSACRLLGLPAAELVGRHVDEVLGVTREGRPFEISSLLADGRPCSEVDGELVTPQLTGPLAISFTLTPLMVGEEQIGGVLVFRDTTERRALQQELTRQAFHDELTGLPNRRLLMDRLDQALARSARDRTSHGLLFFDLDRFKRVNDSYGHAAGDELLIHVAARVRGNVAETDTVARLSGDEFVVLIEDVQTLEQLTAVADRLVELLTMPFEVGGHEVVVSASIGIVLSRPGDNREELLAAADAAAYQAKNTGRNCHHLAMRDDSEAARSRMSLEADLRRAVDRGELEIHYQPVIDTAVDSVRGVEALVRWNRPGHGLVEPASFIPVAEENGMIFPIGRWVLGEACRAVQAWAVHHPGQPPLTLSVNLSGRHFARQHLAEEIAEILSDSGLPAQQLCLEITESVMMADTASTLTTLRTLRDLGVRVAIDDFGTGYSSLSYLRDFPVDAVKIDQSFVREIGHSRADTEIVAAVVRLASALGIDVIAEGVETWEQQSRLADLGCSLMQGYLLSLPCTGEEFLDFWTNTTITAA